MRAQAERIVAKHVDADSNKSEKSGHHKQELQTIDTLLKNADKIDSFLGNNDKHIGHSCSKCEVQSDITDNESCKMERFMLLQSVHTLHPVNNDK